MNKHENDAKSRVFDQLIIQACENELAQRDAEFATRQEPANEGPSPEFDQKMYELFKQEAKKRQKQQNMYAFPKTAACVLICLFIFGVTATSVEAIRLRILNTIVELKEEYLTIDFQAATNDYRIDYSQIPTDGGGIYLPAYLPSGFQLEEAEKNNQHYFLIFGDANGKKIVINQDTLSEGLTVGIDNEDAIRTNITVNNLDITVMEQGSLIPGVPAYTLYWQDKDRFFTISSTVDKNELLKIATSLYLSDFKALAQD